MILKENALRTIRRFLHFPQPHGWDETLSAPRVWNVGSFWMSQRICNAKMQKCESVHQFIGMICVKLPASPVEGDVGSVLSASIR